jgi:hypothetical protein
MEKWTSAFNGTAWHSSTGVSAVTASLRTTFEDFLLSMSWLNAFTGILYPSFNGSRAGGLQ